MACSYSTTIAYGQHYLRANTTLIQHYLRPTLFWEREPTLLTWKSQEFDASPTVWSRAVPAQSHRSVHTGPLTQNVSVHMSTHVCSHVYANVEHICAHVYTHVCVNVYANIYAHIYANVYMHV